MPWRLSLILLCLLPALACAELSAGRLQDIRLQAFGLCSNLLAFYNPNQQAADPRHAERYRQDLLTLRGLLAGQGAASLELAVVEMGEQIDGLEAVPARAMDFGPVALPGIAANGLGPHWDGVFYIRTVGPVTLVR